MPLYYGDAVVPYLCDERYVTAPIFLFSQIAEDELRQRASECGASGYIRKDPELDELVTNVTALLGRNS